MVPSRKSREGLPYHALVTSPATDRDYDSDVIYESSCPLNTSKVTNYSCHNEKTKRCSWLVWALVVVVLQGVTIVLLALGHSPFTFNVSRFESVRNELSGLHVPASYEYRHLIREELKFIPNMTTNDNRHEVEKNWDNLLPVGSGNIKVSDWKKYPLLGRPFRFKNDEFFDIAWTHAIHCLYYVLNSHHQLVVGRQGGGVNKPSTAAIAHFGHCIESLRTQLLCTADMTIVGGDSLTTQGDKRVCRDRKEAIAWIEKNRVDDKQSIVNDGHKLDLTNFCREGVTQESCS